MALRPQSRHNRYGYYLTQSISTHKPRFVNITLSYNDNVHCVKIPQEADREAICREIKNQTGVKGSFYLFDEGKGYLHSSSLTMANIRKMSGEHLQVRGGDWINKGGDSIWYYYSQKLKPEVQQQWDKRLLKPFDKPP